MQAMKRKNIQSRHVYAVERRGPKVMQHSTRDREKKRKQDERQEIVTEGDIQGGVWGKVRNTRNREVLRFNLKSAFPSAGKSINTLLRKRKSCKNLLSSFNMFLFFSLSQQWQYSQTLE